MNVYIPQQVLLASDWGALLGDSCGVVIGLCRQGSGGQARRGRKALAGSQDMTGKAYRPDAGAAGVACDSDKRTGRYFRGRENLLCLRRGSGRLHCQRFFISIISTINNLTHYW
ncbi:MAG: hypothetical protein H0U72_06480 [Nitrosospira sp.]|nr:hypothetical protein [Nitrosospira sp.]